MILLVSNWPAASFWRFLCPTGKFLPEIKEFFILTPTFNQDQANSLFSRKPHSFIAFKIITGILQDNFNN